MYGKTPDNQSLRYYLRNAAKASNDWLRCAGNASGGDRKVLFRAAIEAALTMDDHRMWTLSCAKDIVIPVFYIRDFENLVIPSIRYEIRDGRFIQIGKYTHVRDYVYRHPKHGECQAILGPWCHDRKVAAITFVNRSQATYYFCPQVTHGTQFFLSFSTRYDFKNKRQSKTYRLSWENKDLPIKPKQ